jgi:purine-nucleoside phosphorylase
LKKGFLKKRDRALASIERMCSTTPKIGIILGSGLGEFIDAIKGKVIPFSKIRGFPPSRVEGHRRILKITEGLAVFAGRFHLYEGFDIDDIVLPIFLLQALGVKKLIITNAAGGINPSFYPGDLVLIKDHINLMGVNPLIGPQFEEFGTRFTDMNCAYSKELMACVKRLNVCKMKEGIYAALPGPVYETPAEVRMLRVIGADMVGMSTVPEVIAALYLNMEVIGISCISNMAAGVTYKRISHEEVLNMGNRVAKNFCTLIFAFLKYLGIDPS